MIIVAQLIVAFFGLFLIGVGFMMLLAPVRVWNIIGRAASTPLIHFGELSLRLIPAAGLILFAKRSQFPEIFEILGWFMVGTSIILMLLPRRWHHAYAKKCAVWLPPRMIRLTSPFSMAFGGFILYAII